MRRLWGARATRGNRAATKAWSSGASIERAKLGAVGGGGAKGTWWEVADGGGGVSVSCQSGGGGREKECWRSVT